MYCPCNNCAQDNLGKVTWVWSLDGDDFACGYCGFSANCDWWLDWDGAQLEMQRGPTQMLKYVRLGGNTKELGNTKEHGLTNQFGEPWIYKDRY